jgi:hypothetical protein
MSHAPVFLKDAVELQVDKFAGNVYYIYRGRFLLTYEKKPRFVGVLDEMSPDDFAHSGAGGDDYGVTGGHKLADPKIQQIIRMLTPDEALAKERAKYLAKKKTK